MYVRYIYDVLAKHCTTKKSQLFLLIHMLNLLSTLIGIMAVLFAVIAFIPLFGWAYWAIVPLSMVGVLIGFFSEKTSGRNLNLLVITIGVFRLFIGGGFV